ncbi:hypothetical protein B0T24DRAFT_698268 [Lasiosphaeria ovina]|uniref:Clr5 domain-containing protein n=1 Tax=Lasiosphaeria ovina TaxID=92902 RepID=A0AAE0NA18_9PEZI|nr:hypothetical protein B0T24DRAFT_698268 [Lasiosphaeria ovina]
MCAQKGERRMPCCQVLGPLRITRDIAELLSYSNDAKCLGVSYEQRWEHLKPVIVKLYMGKYCPNGKSMTTRPVADFMQAQYSFHASRILKKEKDDIVAAPGRRSHPGTSTSNVTLGLDKGIDKKQLKRYLSGQIRHHVAVEMLLGVLSPFNFSYAAYVKALGKRNDHSSPFGESSATPSYMNIDDPKTPTPGRESPSMQLTRQKLAQDRASLFLQGHHIELLSSCGKEDRTTITNYLHDFYLFTFVVAKHWGRGPRMTEWTPNMVARITTGARDGVSPASHSPVVITSASRTR